jgi:peptidoglycan hydrolase CwlO-like protein
MKILYILILYIIMFGLRDSKKRLASLRQSVKLCKNEGGKSTGEFLLAKDQMFAEEQDNLKDCENTLNKIRNEYDDLSGLVKNLKLDIGDLKRDLKRNETDCSNKNLEIRKLKKEIVSLKKNNCPFKNIRYVGPLSCRLIQLI